MTDLSHLHALEVRLSHERMRLAASSTPAERTLRQVWVEGIEREIAAERLFLGLPANDPVGMTDDELLAELGL